MTKTLVMILIGLTIIKGNYIDENGDELKLIKEAAHEEVVATEEQMECESEVGGDRLSGTDVGAPNDGDGSIRDSEAGIGSDSGNGESDNADTSEPVREYFGICTISHYCNCSACCGQWAGGNTASGVPPTAGRTVAHNYLPFGTRVLINGVEYVVEDRGDDNMSGGMWFDVYCGSHSEALQRGMYDAEVYVIY